MPKNFKSSLQNRAVGRALARWRADSGMSLSEVTNNVGWSTAKTSMLQNGLQPIPDHDVLALALVYGVADRERQPVLLGAQRAQAPRQFELFGGDAAACVGWSYADVESEANYARMLALEVLPAVVRSTEYEAALRKTQISALSTQDHPHYSETNRARVLDHLHSGPALCLDLVVGEAVLRRPVGGVLVMADQLLRLAEFSGLPGVRVQILPDNVNPSFGMTSFVELSFREDQFNDVAYIETLHDETWLEEKQQVQPYLDMFAYLSSRALNPADTKLRVIEAAQRFKDSKQFT